MEILFKDDDFVYYIYDEHIKRFIYDEDEYLNLKHLNDMCAIALYKHDLGDIPIFLVTDKEILCKSSTEYYRTFPINEKTRDRIDYTITNIKTLINEQII